MAPEHQFDIGFGDSSVSDSAGGSVRSVARGHMSAVLKGVEVAPLGVALDVFGDLRGMIDAAQARRLACEVGVDGDTRVARRKAAAGGAVSKREAGRRAAAAAAVKMNSRLGDMVEDGDLSSEQLDTIALAMRTDESAATDQGLIDSVAAVSVDQGRRIGRAWEAAKTDADRAQSEHDRQRAARRAVQYFDSGKGLSAIKLEGDSAGLYQLWKKIEAEERRLWRMDGGRDVAASKHRRTKDQRLFDAAIGLLTGESGESGGSGDRVAGASRSGGAPVAVLSVGVDQLTGTNPSGCAELIGHGPVADSVAIDLIKNSNLIINLLNLKGETLWWGRAKRHATVNLKIALALRDKGCVRCGADWQRCEAHHLMPWNAPGKGETNLKDMALMCESCHHELHDNSLTLYRKPDGAWASRPATPYETPYETRYETPPRRPARSRSMRRPQESWQLEPVPGQIDSATESNRSSRAETQRPPDKKPHGNAANPDADPDRDSADVG